MPRRQKSVKNNKTSHLVTQRTRAIDLHFHGAFGIDLMRANSAHLTELSSLLLKERVAGYLATTLSDTADALVPAVERLGRHIREGKNPGARPLGIHLEGPFISPKASGAHRIETLRPPTLEELEVLWIKSYKTLKIITLAPEAQASPDRISEILKWALPKKIRISLGHSRATESEAKAVFDLGATGVTHAWNAMAFHHREPGILGAAVGRKSVFIEAIADQMHVSPTLLVWLIQLHKDGLCWISDAAPAAHLPEGQRCTFGNLEIQAQAGACYTVPKDSPNNRPNTPLLGTLAGGAKLTPEALAQLLPKLPKAIQKTALKGLFENPALYLGLSAKEKSLLKKLR